MHKDEACPFCGGEVREVSPGKGICKKCKAQLAKQPDHTPANIPCPHCGGNVEVPADPGANAPTHAQLRFRIKQKIRGGMTMDHAINAACEELLNKPSPPPPPPPAQKKGPTKTCPKCGMELPLETLRCPGCRRSF